MLVLTRRSEQSIVFPGLGITVKVVAIRGGGVRLGIKAPPDVLVIREELLVATPDPLPVLLASPKLS